MRRPPPARQEVDGFIGMVRGESPERLDEPVESRLVVGFHREQSGGSCSDRVEAFDRVLGGRVSREFFENDTY